MDKCYETAAKLIGQPTLITDYKSKGEAVKQADAAVKQAEAALEIATEEYDASERKLVKETEVAYEFLNFRKNAIDEPNWVRILAKHGLLFARKEVEKGFESKLMEQAELPQ